MQRAVRLGFWTVPLAHQLPRVAGSATSLAAALDATAWQASVGLHGQHCDRFVHQPAGLSTIMSHVTTHSPSPPLESDVAQVAAYHPHSGGAQSFSQRALTTAHITWRMTTPSRDNPADLESIQGSPGRPVCFPQVLPLPAVLLPDQGSPRHG